MFLRGTALTHTSQGDGGALARAAQTLPILAWDLFAICGVSYVCLSTLQILLSAIPSAASGSAKWLWLALLHTPSEEMYQCSPQANPHRTGFEFHILCVASTHSRRSVFLAGSSSSFSASNGTGTIIAFRRFMYASICLLSSARTDRRCQDASTKCV